MVSVVQCVRLGENMNEDFSGFEMWLMRGIVNKCGNILHPVPN